MNDEWLAERFEADRTRLQAVAYRLLGSASEADDAVYSVHHPKFKVDEGALPIGSALHVAFALRSLEELR